MLLDPLVSPIHFHKCSSRPAIFVLALYTTPYAHDTFLFSLLSIKTIQVQVNAMTLVIATAVLQAVAALPVIE